MSYPLGVFSHFSFGYYWTVRKTIYPILFLFAFTLSIAQEPVSCTSACLNGGSCSPDTGRCICTPNCEGSRCEICHRDIPYIPILLGIGGFAVTVYLILVVKDFIQRKCRFYSRVSVDDPFVNNMKSIGKAAATKTMTQGELYSPNAFELTSKSRWYRGEN
ncbi:hypothetical protein JH06_3041 [Blastocystis sp. subtype 4]|uniref:hypothetical protein n=1 Tax=Blastocystis sp. subtype 4 TaxID=944170 RepID=UPI0007117EF2|nr:hypothetical protein JH06_3041 [Blastocystis sp. subtype 4]KNB43143.1 hypothetical protein JH06_3041 [Blastocystis sp. subtype 4]|eukprot:XP_014526586.1 hypothetical protein JH06_3041 [Blastocystis sp. subtype 4]